MLPKACLATFLCCLAVATAYYNDNDYGYDYSQDYDAGGYVGDDYGYSEPAYVKPARYGKRRPNAYRSSAAIPRYDDSYMYGYSEEQDYAPRRGYGGGRRQLRMDRYGRSGTYGYSKPRHNVPVITRKKKEKKIKTISIHTGFFIPGGTALFGKFKDLKSCQKACELTPTCFAGDFNPWLNKCYMHSNLTACQSMRAHKQITHFKKVPCNVVETPRGLITLGAAAWSGLEQKTIKSLMDCIKHCSTAGGGIASLPSTATTTPQLCFGITYDFSDHKCFFHVDIAICGGTTAATILTPVTLYAQASAVNIIICPIGADAGGGGG